MNSDLMMTSQLMMVICVKTQYINLSLYLNGYNNNRKGIHKSLLSNWKNKE